MEINELILAERGIARALRAAKAITTNDSDTVRGLDIAERLVAECRIFALAMADSEGSTPEGASRLLSAILGLPVHVTGAGLPYAAALAYCDRNRSRG